MWALDRESGCGDGTSNWFAAIGSLTGPDGDRFRRLRCISERTAAVAENDDHIICVIGRLREYGKDYDLGEPARWLLDRISQDPESLYSGIAGFFAIVILNKRSGEMRLISDHVASVPMYFLCEDEHWWLSDSLKSLEGHVPKAFLTLNPQAIYNYCFLHCIPAPDTVYRDVTKLEPGCLLIVGPDASRETRTLHQPGYDYSTASTADLMKQCQQVIEVAVRRNVAPRSGAFLSGGLDSSTVAGMSAAVQPAVPTFSIGFDAKGYDETEFARATARHFSTSHHEHYLQPIEIIDNFVEVAGFFDEPFGNSSAMAAYVCASVASEHDIDILLAGDGGDEIFAGNERYALQKIFEAWSGVPAGIRSTLDALLRPPLANLPVFSKARSYIDQADTPLPDRMDSWNLLNRFGPDVMFDPSFLRQVDTEAPVQSKRDRYNRCLSPDPVERMMYLDWKFTLADNDLVKVSRMCRKAGVEVRYPLLEKEVVDFSCKVPANVKLPGKKLRDFYKRSFQGFLPEATLKKKKHGFGLPFGVWMKEEPALQQLTHEALDKMRARGIFRADFIDTALRAHRSGHSGYYGELIWIMVVLELWLDSRGR